MVNDKMANDLNILITNDDGWGTQGILTLVRTMLPFGHVVVIAPDGPRSGAAAGITVNKPMYLTRIDGTEYGLGEAEIYTTNGTPADALKLAINALYEGDATKIDLVVSGINHGSNATINVIYSGTMGACLVAAEHGIPAIGFSYNDHAMDIDLTEAEKYIPEITRHLLEEEVPYGIRLKEYSGHASAADIGRKNWHRTPMSRGVPTTRLLAITSILNPMPKIPMSMRLLTTASVSLLPHSTSRRISCFKKS